MIKIMDVPNFEIDETTAMQIMFDFSCRFSKKNKKNKKLVLVGYLIITNNDLSMLHLTVSVCCSGIYYCECDCTYKWNYRPLHITRIYPSEPI
jgi:hypothetical protein